MTLSQSVRPANKDSCIPLVSDVQPITTSGDASSYKTCRLSHCLISPAGTATRAHRVPAPVLSYSPVCKQETRATETEQPNCSSQQQRCAQCAGDVTQRLAVPLPSGPITGLMGCDAALLSHIVEEVHEGLCATLGHRSRAVELMENNTVQIWCSSIN